MAESTDDLSALRIEREPLRPGIGRWVKWLVLLIVVAGGSIAAWLWFNRVRPIEVEVTSVAERPVGTQASVLNASGYVTARRRATVSSKVTGKLIEVNVEEGMAVREGQVLARLDDTTLRASLGLAEAQLAASRQAVPEIEVRLDEARINFRRREQLHKEGLATPAEMDQANAEVKSLVARLDSTREQINVAASQVALQQAALGDMIIRAPFGGVAISKDAQSGEMVSPVSAGGGFTRTGICTIVDMKSLEIEVDVNESYINRVTPRQPVTAVLDAYPDWSIPARVITTVPTADRQKATVLVRIGFDKLDPRILPDMGIKVTFLREGDPAAASLAQPVTLVPKTAVRTDSGGSYVFVVRENTVERRAVQMGGNDGDRLEVKAGLKVGDRVVVSPPAELVEGVEIVIR